jgi:hypothetical protein
LLLKFTEQSKLKPILINNRYSAPGINVLNTNQITALLILPYSFYGWTGDLSCGQKPAQFSHHAIVQLQTLEALRERYGYSNDPLLEKIAAAEATKLTLTITAESPQDINKILASSEYQIALSQWQNAYAELDLKNTRSTTGGIKIGR